MDSESHRRSRHRSFDRKHPDHRIPLRSLQPREWDLQTEIGVSLAHAFHEEPNFTYIVPHTGSRRRALSWFFGSFVTEIGLRRGVVDVAIDGSAASIWLLPDARVSARDALAAGLLRMPYRMGLRAAWRASTVSRVIEGERARRMDAAHWYLMALGVAPEAQGRGIGRALLERGLARADRSGHPAYLETFRGRTARLYARFGFEELGRARVGWVGPRFVMMVRHPPQ